MILVYLGQALIFGLQYLDWCCVRHAGITRGTMSSKSFCVSAGGLSSASVSVAWAGGSWTDAQIRKMCVLIIMYTLHTQIYIYIYTHTNYNIHTYTWCTINWYQLYYYMNIICDYIHLWSFMYCFMNASFIFPSIRRAKSQARTCGLKATTPSAKGPPCKSASEI